MCLFQNNNKGKLLLEALH